MSTWELGSWVKALYRVSQPSRVQVSAGPKAITYILWRAWLYQAFWWILGQTWELAPWPLPSCNLGSTLGGHFFSRGKDAFLAKATPSTENPPEGNLQLGNLFPDGNLTWLSGLWSLSACKISLDCHWTVSEQWFWSAALSTTVVPGQSPSTHESSHFHQPGCFSARKILATLPEKHSLRGLLEKQILPAFYTPLKNEM